MNEVSLKEISYGQLRENNWQSDQDKYGLAAFVDENVKKAFVESPNNDDNTKTAILFALDNGDIVGRHLLYATKIKMGDSVIKAQSSGSTEVHDSQRGKGIGSKINRWTLNNDEYPVYICSLLSPACLRLMEKKENGCTIFDFPELIKIINTEAAFAVRGMKGIALGICKSVGNAMTWFLDIPNRTKLRKLKKKYNVERLFSIPQWAGEMCLNDGHKYAEYHDVAWLEWSVFHNLSGQPEDKQSFYAIYDQNKTPVGFFITKERKRRDINNYDRMICGTLCEWASVSGDLKESDINLLALPTFSKNCYHVLTVTDNPKTVNELRRMGYVNHGSMQMGFKDKKNQFPDMADQSKWRIRYGCCNSILY